MHTLITFRFTRTHTRGHTHVLLSIDIEEEGEKFTNHYQRYGKDGKR